MQSKNRFKTLSKSLRLRGLRQRRTRAEALTIYCLFVLWTSMALGFRWSNNWFMVMREGVVWFKWKEELGMGVLRIVFSAHVALFHWQSCHINILFIFWVNLFKTQNKLVSHSTTWIGLTWPAGSLLQEADSWSNLLFINWDHNPWYRQHRHMDWA